LNSCWIADLGQREREKSIHHRCKEFTEDFLFFAHRETAMGKKNPAFQPKIFTKLASAPLYMTLIPFDRQSCKFSFAGGRPLNL
jgi:hypothetical protein